jgi:hypothetical protein
MLLALISAIYTMDGVILTLSLTTFLRGWRSWAPGPRGRVQYLL